MSISDVLNIATSGLNVAQAQVSATSDNIANVNTPGYARKVVTQSETVVQGKGLGVHIDSIQRAYNGFMQKASLSATAQAGQAQVISDFLDQAQQMFGDPSMSTSYFANLDNVYSSFSAASDTPSSSLSRTDAINSVNQFLSSSTGLSNQLSGLRDEANQRASSDVAQINSLLGQISQLNSDIARVTVSGGDASGSQNTQSQLLDQLSSLMQVNMTANNTGGVVLRSQDGVYLAGDQGAATLSYATVGQGNLLTATPPKGQPMQITPGGGELAGLMHLSGVDIPQQLSQLSEFVAQAVNQINAAHNNDTSVPAPNLLQGQQIGMSLPTAIANFNGKTTIAITDASGVITQKLDVTFGFGTGHIDVTNSGGTSTVNFTSANFLTQLNAALGSSGSASFVNGALSISANSGTDGVSIINDATTPSSNSGASFSQFFGLSNLIQSTSNLAVNGSLNVNSPNTFATGGTLSLELSDANGAGLRQVNLTIPASAATVGDLINGLNSTVGAYGSFGLDAQGHIAFTPSNGYPGATVSVISDNTQNAAGGLNLTQMFGLGGDTQASRTASYAVRADIAANPSKLALAQLDLTQAVGGSPAIGVGDGRGAVALANSGNVSTTFSSAGGIKSASMSVSAYASELAGQVGATATSADNKAKAAQALQTQATAQRSAAEGVNLDSELVNLTTFQQSYNACARLIQASKDMYDTLLQIL